jgi:hypothetical protein
VLRASVDTRTGYIYSAYEVTERAETFATTWGSSEAADEARRDNERRAFKKLVDEVTASWQGVLARHGVKS